MQGALRRRAKSERRRTGSEQNDGTISSAIEKQVRGSQRRQSANALRGVRG